MKSNNLFIPLLVMVLLSGCGGSGGGTSTTSGTSTGTGGTTTGGTTSTGPTTSTTSVANVLAVTVNGSLCSSSTSSGYPNKPCVTVTICTPGTSTCQTVSDILLDTGSYGLRIFSTALTGVSLTQVASASGGSLAECVQFGDGSELWGPVMTADVILGGESAVSMPIQVVNASFGSRPTTCRSADAAPSDAGFNGILGVGLFAQDCGTGCSNSANNGNYYSVSGSSTTATAAPLASQVINPVAMLPKDNTGVIVQLPTVDTGGAASAEGSLILGIDTQTNNASSSVTMYPSDQSAEFLTTYNGTSYYSFLDTGSNGLYFPVTSLLSACAVSGYSGWFCPSSTTSLSAVNAGYAGTPTGTVSFSIGNAVNMLNSSSYAVFPTLGGVLSSEFDWGLPFFLGRSVYVGIDGTTSSLGTGPYWAY